MRLAHYAIRASDLAASIRFYEDVLGLREGPRPRFGFPGAWLYAPGDRDPDSQGVVHLIAAPDAAGNASALDAYLGERGLADGSGVIDHIAFAADDWPAQRTRFEAAGIPCSERSVPGLGLR